MPKQIDVNSIIENSEISLTPIEHDDDRLARIGRENFEHQVTVWKDVALTGVSLLVFVGLTLASLHTLLIAHTPTVDAVQWARTALLTFAGSLATFLLARAKK